MSRLLPFALLTLPIALIACGGEDDPMVPAEIEIAGTYTSNFDTTETIDSDTWHTVGMGFTSDVTVIEFDNAANSAVTQNAASDAFNPSKFNKVVWTEPNAGVFHYCTVDFAKASAMAAKTSTQTADARAPDASGCGGFSWTKLTAK